MTELSLNDTRVSDITPLASLIQMAKLSLKNTQVSDITGLVGMAKLTWLNLTGTQVNDLRPLLKLDRLGAPDSPVDSIWFSNTPAIQRDPKLAKIDAIKNGEARIHALFSYLRKAGDDWPPMP